MTQLLTDEGIAAAIGVLNRLPWRPPPPAAPGPETRPDLVTYDAIAAELGLTRQAICAIERRALEKCRRWCDRHGYRLEDLLR